jgi:hypothetical protein
MRTLLALLVVTAMGCVVHEGTTGTPPGNESGSGSGAGSGSGSGSGSGGDNVVCQFDVCQCPTDAACVHTCAAGAPECHVNGAPGESVDVQCDENGDCHVACGDSTSCRVECGSSADCHVECPATGCTVTDCDPAAGCVVACGLNGPATLTGTTATCP